MDGSSGDAYQIALGSTRNPSGAFFPRAAQRSAEVTPTRSFIRSLNRGEMVSRAQLLFPLFAPLERLKPFYFP